MPQHNAAEFQPADDDVFARIATRYDTLCDVFSLYLHRNWKARMARHIARAPGSVWLDVAQALRVLKPGGLFFCLEASRIRWGWLHAAYLRYMQWCLPLIARLKGDNDTSTYRYFLQGIQEFPDQQALTQELQAAGFTDVCHENMSLGIVALHQGRKPGDSP